MYCNIPTNKIIFTALKNCRYEAAKRRAQSTKYPSRLFLAPADMLARPTAVPCTEQTPHCQSGSWKLRKTAFWS